MSSFSAMNEDQPQPSLRLPRSALALLSDRCAALGPDGVRALREAGYRAGLALGSSIAEDPGALPVSGFWTAVSSAFEDNGLGTVRFELVSRSIGAVYWTGSPEASGTRPDRPDARCHFAAGLLAGLLRRTVGTTVDVLELRCGGADRECRFVFGTVATMRAVQHAAREGGERRMKTEAGVAT